MQEDQSSNFSQSALPGDTGVATSQYFTVGAVKFAVMSLTTCGLYELFWFHKNWKIIRERDRLDISPFWRAVFAPLWSFSLGERFAKQASANDVVISLPVVPLGIMYLVVSALWRLPEPYWLLSLLSFVPIMPFDFAARGLNGNGQLAEPLYGRYSGWNIAWLILGTLLLGLIV